MQEYQQINHINRAKVYHKARAYPPSEKTNRSEEDVDLSSSTALEGERGLRESVSYDFFVGKCTPILFIRVYSHLR